MSDHSSASIASLADALAKAQGEISAPKKSHTATVPTKTGGSYSYRYSTLDELVDVLRVPLSRHGLSFVQSIAQGDRTIGVATTILHASGEWISTGTVLLPSGDTPQSYGSALTYARRYSLGAAFGIAAEDDDDANTAEREVKTRKASPTPTPENPPAPTDALPPGVYKGSAITLTVQQIDAIRAALKTHKVSAAALKAMLEKDAGLVVRSAADIPQIYFDATMKWITNGGQT